MANRLLLFGGTFDPVHHGHLIIARAVVEQGGFDKVTLVPAAMPPHKSRAHASSADRLAMLKLAVEGDDGFDICEDELNRPAPSYTLDTLQTLKRRMGLDTDLHLLIGADMLAELPMWHRVAEMMELATLVVATRPPLGERMSGILESLSKAMGREAADRLAANIFQTPLIDISSTDIRRRVAAGKSIRFLVPSAVADYVLSHGLYAGQRNSP